MSTLKHMREPWNTVVHASGNPTLIHASGSHIAECWSLAKDVNSPANAARIVACVNACEGMEDPAAHIHRLRDLYEDLHAVQNEARKLLIQRNELLAALEELMEMPGEQLGKIRASYNIARNYPVKPEVAEQAAKFALFVNLVAEVKGGKS